MKHSILALVLALGLGANAWAQDGNGAGVESSTAAATTDTGTDAGTTSNSSDTKSDKGKGIHFSITADTDKDSDEQLKREVVDRLFNVVEKAAESEGKLGAEDRESLTKLLTESDGSRSPGRTFEALGGLLIGALAIVVIFGMPVMIVAAVLYASYRKKRLVHDTINQYLASGKDIPPEIMEGLHRETSSTPKSNLHKGLILIGVGLGIVAAFTSIDAEEVAYLGLIPLFIGAAQLLIWMIEKGGNGKKA